jgi:hypothetical protein
MLLQTQNLSSAFKALNPADTLSLKLQTANLNIHTLQIKMDSLEKIMVKTQIGSDFFSNAISSNLYNFSTIVFFAGLVLWGSLYGSLAIHKRQIKRNFATEVQTLKSDLDGRFAELEQILYDTSHDVNRAMYSKVTADKDWPNSFDWALSCSKSVVNYYPELPDQIATWLEMAETSLNLVPVGNPRLVEITSRITEYLTPLTLSENESVKVVSSRILRTFNHLVYTIPTVPEDLFETQSTDEPILDNSSAPSQ